MKVRRARGVTRESRTQESEDEGQEGQGVTRESRTQESEDEGQEGQGSDERIKDTGV